MSVQYSRLTRIVVASMLAGLWLTSCGALRAEEEATGKYRSPLALAVSPDGKTAYVTDQSSGNVTFLDIGDRKAIGEVAVRGRPQGVALSADGKLLYVAEHGAGSVVLIDTAKQAVVSRVEAGRWPTAVALAAKAGRLFVCNQDRHSVSVIDVASGKTITEVAVSREPSFAAITPNEQFVVVTNLLAHGTGSDPTLAADVTILDATNLTVAKTVKLLTGSTCVYGACISPDGRFAYVVHALGRFNLPITQLDRGWVNTFALSVIDVAQGTRLVTLLLDDLTQGAADPYAVVCSRDGSQLWISHAGVHSISNVRIGLVHELLTGKVPPELAALKDAAQANIWVRIGKDPAQVAELENDLTALYIAGAIRRFNSGGISPRGIVLSPDEKQLLVTNYFSGSVAILDAAEGKLLDTISLGTQPEANAVRRGERIFHDATHAFQHWHSCASCHPNDGRVDGLRWDFLGDGIGNPKDTMNLTWMHMTEPLNRRATVATAKACTKNGLMFTNMIVPTEPQIEDLYAYLTSLTPVPSFHLKADGGLTDSALRGRTLFEGRAGCVSCHSDSVFTDRKMHNVGVLSPNEPDGRYDTPSLVEAYRTAPYLHDGRALTVKDVLTTHNEQDEHGNLGDFSDQEIDDLVNYILSL